MMNDFMEILGMELSQLYTFCTSAQERLQLPIFCSISLEATRHSGCEEAVNPPSPRILLPTLLGSDVGEVERISSTT